MSHADKTNKQDSPGFLVNPMNMYGVAGCGIPLPVFTPQFGPMVPLRMMTPMWPVSPSLLPPCTGSISGTSAKPKSDAADDEASSNDQSDGKMVPSIWALNGSSMQEYIQNMSTSVLKSSDGLGTCAGMMMTPMWPMNAAFMQQCIGSSGGAASNPVAKETSCENEAEKEGVASTTAASGVQGPTSTVCGDEKTVVVAESTAEADKGDSNVPHAASSATHVNKVPEMAFPGGTPFMPFSNIAGFIPYTTYIPCFKPVDINQRSSADQQVESSKSASKTEHSIPGQVPEEEKSVNNPVDMEQEHTEDNLPEELGGNEQDEVSIPNDSGCSGVSDTGNSAEMDVAQILVNFMPVPVIGSTGQEGTDESDGEQEASVLVMEEGTASLAEPQADSDAAMDESASSMGALQYCPADKLTTKENQQDADDSKAQITQGKMSIQNTTEANPKVDSMEVSVIKNSKDVIMEAQETSTGHSPTLLRENGPQLSETKQEENVTSGGHIVETGIEKQVLQPVLNKPAPPDISDEQVSPPSSVEMPTSETSNGQAVPCTSVVASVEPVVEAQMTQPVVSTPTSEVLLVECRDCGVQAGPNAFEGQITTSVPNRDVPAQPHKDQVRANSTMMQVVQSVLEGQVALGVSKVEVTMLPLSQQVVSSLSDMPVVEVKQERDDSIDIEYQVGGNSSNGAEIKGGIPKMAEMAYKCEVCSQLFRSPLGLQKHLEFHTDDGQHYTCTICFERFQDSDTLQGHVAYHMRKRPHKCNFCPKAFRDPGSLQKHVRVHTGEKPYKCTNCFRSFAEYSSLRKHLRVHTGEQPYKCQYCTKAFSISGNLQRHTLIHTGERPYKCSFCPKAFNNPSHLRRHVKNLHFKGEGGSGAEVMIAMAAAVAAAEGKMALGNGQLAVGAPATASNTAASSGSFTDTAPQKNNKEQTGILADQNIIMKVDFPAAATQPDTIK